MQYHISFFRDQVCAYFPNLQNSFFIILDIANNISSVHQNIKEAILILEPGFLCLWFIFSMSYKYQIYNINFLFFNFPTIYIII